jgi:cytochrome oxidase Cu insertion factor (SCO1/SenC/PrrC family)
MKNGIIITVVVIILLIIGGFFLFNNSTSSTSKTNQDIVPTPSAQSKININNKAWADIELKDINTQSTYTIKQLNSKPILLESFAVWCPTCTKQQKIIKDLHNEEDNFISISLDTDASEDEEKILAHTQSNGFDWRYSVSPIELTQSLIEDFGPGIVFAPSVPLILICPNGDAEKLPNGVKSIDDLKTAIASC